mmetsp:Transcript_18478/g.55453  ORF Transcript_18478/g.55453 Transcript_18478/m.55453 type:complete len:475 (+) Transcript_18478:89-1513(+)|eukprot:CAMPEP_0174235618 /NCGR_PEP_ID=MMETSP0417-20130205/5002_1 /TAXON_ID=242541 /ORGANISM="Mayorella sp, Strain BSH-02190019" /LENGTH=474 /DNA_ID=CAMNT_0015314143 /DNA_START=66 /DNA_END=1490 /DNA_ORIENTATION=+
MAGLYDDLPPASDESSPRLSSVTPGSSSGHSQGTSRQEENASSWNQWRAKNATDSKKAAKASIAAWVAPSASLVPRQLRTQKSSRTSSNSSSGLSQTSRSSSKSHKATADRVSFPLALVSSTKRKQATTHQLFNTGNAEHSVTEAERKRHKSTNLPEDSVSEEADEYDPLSPNDYETELARHLAERSTSSQQTDDRIEDEVFLPARPTVAIPPPASYHGEETSHIIRESTAAVPPQPTPPPPPPPTNIQAETGEEAYLRRANLSQNISGEEAFRRRAQLSFQGGGAPPIARNSPPASPPKTSFAERMMQKMGWKEGQGLGKRDQGRIEPLRAQPSQPGSVTGRVIDPHASSSQHPRPTSNQEISRSHSTKSLPEITDTHTTPSTVVLLRNMVQVGEVDDELEEETLDECSKYGKLLQCKVVELPTHVRVFLEFEEVSSAERAQQDLHNRMFGGRRVDASFYKVNCFRRGLYSIQ